MTTTKKILSGAFLQNDFLRKNVLYMAFFFILIFIYIIINSYGDIQSAKIDSLRKKVNALKQESIIYESKLMEQGLESNVAKLVKNKGLNLERPNEPTLIIKIDNVNEGKK